MSDLKDFLEEKAKRSEEALACIAKRMEWWKLQIAELYDEVEKWLTLVGPIVSVSRRVCQISEIITEEYFTECMIITVGPEHVELSPVGTYAVDTFGRIDIIGNKGTAKIVLLELDAFPATTSSLNSVSSEGIDEAAMIHAPAPSDPKWYLMEQGEVDSSYREFNEETFAVALKRVMDDVAP